MANELTINLTMALANGELVENFAPAQLSVDQDSVGAYRAVQIVGSSAEEDMAVGDVASEGWLFLKNLDPVNYVTYGPNDGAVMEPIGRIEAGEFAALRMEPGTTMRMQADTAPVKVQIILLED